MLHPLSPCCLRPLLGWPSEHHRWVAWSTGAHFPRSWRLEVNQTPARPPGEAFPWLADGTFPLCPRGGERALVSSLGTSPTRATPHAITLGAGERNNWVSIQGPTVIY